MIRRALFLFSLVLLALAIAVPANSQGMRQSRKGQFWGTFVHWAEFGPGIKFAGLVTVNVDGTFRAGNVHGAWEKVGEKRAYFTGYVLQTDASGQTIGIERHRCYLDYNDDFTAYSGWEVPDATACPTAVSCPDPLDPATTWSPVPWAPNGFKAAGARVEVVPPPVVPPLK